MTEIFGVIYSRSTALVNQFFEEFDMILKKSYKIRIYEDIPVGMRRL
jgi:hypothetical protein